MFERYTERARRVLFFARYEAIQLGSIAIESEHLLLGLLREGKGLTSQLFARHHASPDHIRRQLESRVVFREKLSTSVEIPFTTEVKSILQYAADEADRLLHNYIGTEHLLLGIMRAERSVAASILANHGFRLEDLRNEITELLSSAEHTSHATADQAAVAAAIHAVAGGAPHVPASLPPEIVHISFTTHSATGIWFSESPRHWHITGAGLPALIARAYRTEESRTVMPADLVDERRYDVVLLLTRDESPEAIARRVQQAIEEAFQVAVAREVRPEGEVLVVRRR